MTSVCVGWLAGLVALLELRWEKRHGRSSGVCFLPFFFSGRGGARWGFLLTMMVVAAAAAAAARDWASADIFFIPGLV